MKQLIYLLLSCQKRVANSKTNKNQWFPTLQVGIVRFFSEHVLPLLLLFLLPLSLPQTPSHYRRRQEPQSPSDSLTLSATTLPLLARQELPASLRTPQNPFHYRRRQEPPVSLRIPQNPSDCLPVWRRQRNIIVTFALSNTAETLLGHSWNMTGTPLEYGLDNARTSRGHGWNTIATHDWDTAGTRRRLEHDWNMAAWNCCV